MEEKYNNLVKYVSYLAEKLDTSISHQDHIADEANKMIAHQDYLAENMNKMIAHQNHIVEESNKLIEYSNYLAESMNNKTENTVNETNVEEEVKETVNESKVVVEESKFDSKKYQMELGSKLDALISTVKTNYAEAKEKEAAALEESKSKINSTDFNLINYIIRKIAYTSYTRLVLCSKYNFFSSLFFSTFDHIEHLFFNWH